MEKLKFKKDIYTLNIPFMLNNFDPWQEQIKRELQNIQGKYTYRKSARLGFEITENCATIKLYKS